MSSSGLLQKAYPRYGYPTLHDMLKSKGWVINRKRTYRLYRDEGLQVRTKRRKKLYRPRVPMLVPSVANERWSIDFMSDQLSSEQRFRVVNVVDDYTRECVFLGRRLFNLKDSGWPLSSIGLHKVEPLRRHWCATTDQSSRAKRCFFGRSTPV